jgi:hypothetical protein
MKARTGCQENLGRNSKQAGTVDAVICALTARGIEITEDGVRLVRAKPGCYTEDKGLPKTQGKALLDQFLKWEQGTCTIGDCLPSRRVS